MSEPAHTAKAAWDACTRFDFEIIFLATLVNVASEEMFSCGLKSLKSMVELWRSLNPALWTGGLMKDHMLAPLC